MDRILEIKEANSKYWQFIRELRTHPLLKEGFISQGDITPSDQIAYMKKYHKSYWVAIIENTPIGFVGVVDNDIRVAILPDYQKRGYAKQLIEFVNKKYPDAIARVKVENLASLKLFQSAKFKIKGIEEKEGEPLYVLSK